MNGNRHLGKLDRWLGDLPNGAQPHVPGSSYPSSRGNHDVPMGFEMHAGMPMEPAMDLDAVNPAQKAALIAVRAFNKSIALQHQPGECWSY